MPPRRYSPDYRRDAVGTHKIWISPACSSGAALKIWAVDANNDITSHSFYPKTCAPIIPCPAKMAFCGKRLGGRGLYSMAGDDVNITWHVEDGDSIKANQPLFELDESASAFY